MKQYIEDYKIIKLLGRGKSAYSYLVEKDQSFFVYKQMHQEKIDYYQFDDKLEHELIAYKYLENSSIRIPKLVSFNKKKQYLIKEYIEGPTLAEYICKGLFDLDAYLTLYAHAMMLEDKKINIDYFPTNFIIKDHEIIYIDYEINKYDSKWDFLNWGSIFLFHQKGFEYYLKDFKDTTYLLNEDHMPLVAPVKKDYQGFIELTKLLPIKDIIAALKKEEENLKIKYISRIHSGFAAKVFKIETMHNAYIYKVYDDLSKIETIKLEIKAYQHPNGYMPKMIKYDQAQEYVWMLIEYIDGMKTMDLYKNTKDDQLIDDFTDVLIDIHQERNTQQTISFIEEEINEIEQINHILNDQKVTVILKELKKKMSTLSSTVLSRIHGDYHPWNTLHKNQKIFVIDWIYRYGDYRYDVMWTYALLYRSGFEDFAQRFLNRYKQRLDIDNQDFFLTLANLRWFVNVKLSLKQQQQEDLYDIIKFQSEKLNELNPYFSDKMLSFE